MSCTNHTHSTFSSTQYKCLENGCRFSFFVSRLLDCRKVFGVFRGKRNQIEFLFAHTLYVIFLYREHDML